MKDPLLLLSFIAGSLTFVNPCGVALLPAYVSYYLGVSGEEKGVKAGLVFKGLLLGIISTAGFMIVFGGSGMLFSIAGVWLLRYVPWLAVGVGAAIILVGLAMITGRTLFVNTSFIQASPSRLGYYRFLAFGVVYAIASLSCTIPVFIYITLQAMSAGGVIGALSVFASYSIGMGSMMVLFSLGISIARDAVVRVVQRILPYANRMLGVVMLLSGAYILYLQLYVGGLVG